jgi:hypothetical protein
MPYKYDFKRGELIKAEEINENFRLLKEEPYAFFGPDAIQGNIIKDGTITFQELSPEVLEILQKVPSLEIDISNIELEILQINSNIRDILQQIPKNLTDLSDFPKSYALQGDKFLKVRSTEDGIEFVEFPVVVQQVVIEVLLEPGEEKILPNPLEKEILSLDIFELLPISGYGGGTNRWVRSDAHLAILEISSSIIQVKNVADIQKRFKILLLAKI